MSRVGTGLQELIAAVLIVTILNFLFNRTNHYGDGSIQNIYPDDATEGTLEFQKALGVVKSSAIFKLEGL